LLDRQALHARSLTFRHPVSAETLFVEAPIPADMESVVDGLRAHS